MLARTFLLFTVLTLGLHFAEVAAAGPNDPAGYLPTPEDLIQKIQEQTGWRDTGRRHVDPRTGKTLYIFSANSYAIRPDQTEDPNTIVERIEVPLDNLPQFLKQVEKFGQPRPLRQRVMPLELDAIWWKPRLFSFRFDAPESPHFFFPDEEYRRAEALEKRMGIESYYDRAPGQRTRFTFHFGPRKAFVIKYPGIFLAAVEQFGRPLEPTDVHADLMLFPEQELKDARRLARHLELDGPFLPNGQPIRNASELSASTGFVFKDPRTGFAFTVPGLSLNYGAYYPLITDVLEAALRITPKDFHEGLLRPERAALLPALHQAATVKGWQSMNLGDKKPLPVLRTARPTRTDRLGLAMVYDTYYPANSKAGKTVDVIDPIAILTRLSPQAAEVHARLGGAGLACYLGFFH